MPSKQGNSTKQPGHFRMEESTSTKLLVRALRSEPEGTPGSTTPASTTTHACDNFTSCDSCTNAWPMCAWCGTHNTCLPSTEDLVSIVRRSYSSGEDLHVVYKYEEYKATYGSWPYFAIYSGDCGVWIFKQTSCIRVSQHCSRYNDCQRCTNIDGCGFCYANNYGKVPAGKCLPGTANSQIGMTTDRVTCGTPTSRWLFGNWTKAYQENLWDSPCEERCPRQRQLLNQTEGSLSLGSPGHTMSYAGNLECSWLIAPEPWPKDGQLEVKLAMIRALTRGDAESNGDVVRLYAAGSNSSSSQVGKQLTIVGCDWDDEDAQQRAAAGEDVCVQDSSIRVSGPVVVWFKSQPLGDRELPLNGAGWQVTWSIYQQPDTGVSTTDSGGFTLWWLACLLVLVLPLGCMIWMLRRRCTVIQALTGNGQDAGRVDGVSAADLFDDFLRPVNQVDVAALERNCPECKPRVIGASQVDDGEAQACSVCLGTPSLGDEVRSLPCGHQFHKDCIDIWLRKSVHCPLCRKQINLPGAERSVLQMGASTAANGSTLTPVMPATQVPSSNSVAGAQGATDMSGTEELAAVDV